MIAAESFFGVCRSRMSWCVPSSRTLFCAFYAQLNKQLIIAESFRRTNPYPALTRLYTLPAHLRIAQLGPESAMI